MVWKVLWDDHRKVEGMFNRYSKGESSLVATICEELELHATIEEEIVYPALAQLDERLAQESEEDHEDVKEIIAEIQDLEPGDPMESKLMKKLERLVSLHVTREERDVFPIIKSRLNDESYEMGRQAFALRQEALGARDGGSSSKNVLGWPGSGWGKSKVVGGGW
jgi:iron-sulfur cluster repair protein YtfE (RIC family)